jgi:hypothetical protein
MIVSLELLKPALGIDLTDTDQDARLTELEGRMVEWVEGQTKHRFQEPLARIEYKSGADRAQLYLSGHIEASTGEHPEFSVVTVDERVQFGDWELVDPADYERRENMLLRIDGSPWMRAAEYRISYMDGYSVAPGDIQALVQELIVGQYVAETASADGSTGIASETLVGVYSYSINSATRSASVPGGGSLSEIGKKTLGRYRRMFV